MLRTKCILTPRDGNDGLRISVMSRHTLSNGRTPDKRIIENISYDSWIPELAPPSMLVRDFYRKNLSFEGLIEKYQEYLQTQEARERVIELAEKALKSDVTILCIEESPERCHRRFLAEECRKYRPSLILDIK
ncbi:MAG: DUF488 domain-containing protein [Nanoarchaeota archaeon]